VLCEGVSRVCNKNVTESQAKRDTSLVCDSLESYSRALESVGVTSYKRGSMLFPFVESRVPKDVLRVLLANTGTLLMDDDGSSIFGDRIKDFSFLRSEDVGEGRSFLLKPVSC